MSMTSVARGLKRKRGEEEDRAHPTNTQELGRYHGYSIGNIEIRDAARAQFGDNYVTNNFYNTTHPQSDNYDTLFASLTFDRIDARIQNIATALPMTCDWLPQHPQFLVWINDSEIHDRHGFLWIKGIPGSGKSTVIKEMLTWALRTCPGQLILSYFFNARSPHTLEKSSRGLYRSLLHQLLKVLPSARESFVAHFEYKVRNKEVESWTEVELQNFWIQLVRMPQLPSIVIFVDALDEDTDDDDVRQMVKFLERLTQDINPSARPLRVCLSSRHYPHISVARSCSLVVEDQAGRA